MAITYKEIDNLGYKIIEKDDNGVISWIPIDEGNSDYQRYVHWLENPDVDESGTF